MQVTRQKAELLACLHGGASENDAIDLLGTERLHGAPTSSVDLRGGAALVIAALAAEGTTYIDNIQTLKRGYDSLVDKLKGVGADIEIVEKRDDD